MSVKEFLKELKDNQIGVGVEGDRLSVEAAEGALTDELIQEIRLRKEELLEYLKMESVLDPVLETETDTAQKLYPMSFAQKRLWVIEQLGGASLAYNIPMRFTMEEVDKVLFEKAINFLVNRHEVLRTTFHVVNGEPVQKVNSLAESGFKVEFVDLRSKENPISVYKEIASESSKHLFDLSKGPLLAIKLVQLSDKEYRVIFDIHHIIFDGWSEDVFKKEFLQVYSQLAEGQAISLKPLTMQYRDYTQWQITQQQEGHWEEHKQFWHELFQGEVPVLELKKQNQLSNQPSLKASSINFFLESKVHEKLKAACFGQHATFNMGLLALTYLILYKHTGQTDLVIGTPIAGRSQIEFEDQLGFYVNSLPLRLEFDEEDTFNTLLDKVRELTLQAYHHQDYPFDLLVDELNLDRAVAESPLFNVMVVSGHTNTPFNNEKEFEVTDNGVPKFDLMIGYTEGPDGLEVRISYATPAFADSQMKQMAKRFKEMVQKLFQNQEAPIGKLPYVPAEELKQIDGFTTSNEVPFQSATIQQLVEEQCRQTPDAIAVRCGAESLTYAELSKQSDAFAAILKEQYGIKRQDLVGVMISRDKRLPVLLLGILKAGAAYVPLDPAYPAERIAFMIADTCMPLVLIDEKAASKPELAACYGNCKTINVDALELSDYEGSKPPEVNSPEDTAYIIYTSGTTGKPKGVVLSHHNACALVHWGKNEFGRSDFQTVYAVTSYCFDLSVFELFYTLSSGKTLRVLENALEIPKWLPNDEKVLLNTVPSVVRNLILENTPLSSVNVLNMAGEPIPQSVINALDTAQIEVRNLYGPSEYATYSTCYRFEPGDQKVLIGKPLQNTRVYILDEHLQQVPVGVRGELYVTGEHLSAGYINRPELTWERFIDNPFEPGQKLYATGDLCCWDDQGNIEYSGRKDFQVKVRGYRIEIGEIESVLSVCAGVHQSAVMVVGDREEELAIVAFYSGEADQKEEIMQIMKEKLPHFMVPKSLVYLDDFPLLPNGKTDKKKLEAYDLEVEEKNNPYVPAANEEQQQLTEIWEEVLQRKPVGLDDNFFEIGGQSLKAMRIMSRVYQQFGFNISLKNIHENATVRKLSAFILEKLGKQAPEEVNGQENVSEKSTSGVSTYPMSFAQRRLWITSQFEEAVTAYNMGSDFSIEDLDEKAFEDCFYGLVERHEILRTTFSSGSEEPQQLVWPADSFKLPIEYLDFRTYDDPAEQFKAYKKEKNAQPFDLVKGPLFSLSVIKISDKRSQILLVMHHIITDEWSMRVLREDFVKLYEKRIKGQPLATEELTYQYKDFSLWQQQQMADGAFDRHRTYWRDQFSGGIEPAQLVTDYPRPKSRTYKGASVKISIGDEKRRQLQKICTTNDTSMFVGLLSLFNVLMYRSTRQQDVILGTPMAGRDQVQLQNQVGFYVNTVPIRTQVTPEDSFNDLLAKVRDTVYETFEHQAYPFDMLIDELKLDRDASRNPLFDVMVSSSSNSQQYEENDALLFVEGIESKFDLNVVFNLGASGLQFNIQYNTDLFEQERIVRMAAHMKELLQEVCLEPNRSVDELNILPAEEKHFLLHEINDTASDYPNQHSISEVFRAVVDQYPDKTAVVSAGERLTYQQLDQKANQVSHCLRENWKVKEGDRVGILSGRSADTIVLIMALLKAGATYVPIDASYPEERIQWMLSDAELSLLIHDDSTSLEPYTIKEKEALKNVMHIASTFAGETPDVKISPKATAYVMYTSGSTGKPKGVMVNQRNIIRLVKNTNYFDFAPEHKMLQVGSLSFDAFTFELFGMLLNGGELHLLSQDELSDTSAIARKIQEDQISSALFTSAWLNQLVDEDISVFKEMKHLFTGGEKISVAHANKLVNTYPGLKVTNCYGPTENTTISTFHTFTQPYKHDIPIGKPVGNSQVYVLDEKQRLVPAGVVGEIYVGGDGVANGYLNREEQTQEKFIEHPEIQGRLYRTGDFGYFRPDGELMFKGREDDQVKVRGYRIELNEIINQMTGCQGVEQAHVLAKADETGQKCLIGYYSGEASDAAVLREKLRERLPEFMIPAYLIHLEKFPITANGKVDVKQLPEPDGQLSVSNDLIAPGNKLEERLLLIWQEVLGLEKVGVTANFFEMGGQSLKAIKILTRLNREFSVDLKINDLFMAPSVRALAEKVADRKDIPLSVDLNSGKEGTTMMYMIPPVLGVPALYMPLASRLEEMYHCKGLLFKGADGSVPFDKSIADMARSHAREILKEQKDKVVLLGYSMGAVLAFEVAKILEEQAVTVKLLLLDKNTDLDKRDAVILDALTEDDVERYFDVEVNGLSRKMELDPDELRNMKKLFSHNLDLLKVHRIEGKVKADLVAIEAEKAELPHDMQRWEAFTEGRFAHMYSDGDHSQALSDANLTQLVEVLSAFNK